MKAAFFIAVGYAILGVIYAPGVHSFVALLFVAVWCAPLLLAEYADDAAVPHPKPGVFFYWTILLLGFLNLTVIARNAQVPVSALLSLDGIARTAVASTLNRYQDQAASGNPFLLALSLFLLYRVGASTFSMSRTAKLLAFLPLVLYAMLSTEKWPLFLGGAFFIAGLFVGYPYRRARNASIFYAGMFGALGVVVGGAALILRGSEKVGSELASLMLHYIAAPYSAFGYWLLTFGEDACCSFGQMSFIGPLNALGYVRRVAGIHEANFVLYGEETNIYTAWRYLVTDFTLAGPFVFNTALAIAFIGSAMAKLYPVSTAIKAFVLLSAILSMNVTLFVHNSTALAGLVCMMFSGFIAFSVSPRLSQTPMTPDLPQQR